MTEDAKNKIRKLITDKVKAKIAEYAPESKHRPFIEAILSENDIFIHSFAQSIYTTIGMSIYEQMGKIIAEDAGAYAERQYVLQGAVDPSTASKITEIWEAVKTSGGSNKEKEVEEIRRLVQHTDSPTRIPESVVDLYIKKPNGEEYYFDITTVKPNKKEFETLKRKMLLWAALRLSIDKDVKLGTYIAIPYNPYHPDPYARWNAKCLDPKGDILVQEDFWNCIGDSDKTYQELLDLFVDLGEELRGLVAKFLANRNSLSSSQPSLLQQE